ncbi:MAG: Ig-like domain-containing protein [Chitinivibrionia bacterium]|nr:Ig-like domain-containing protein [Chitinivibrionia bacterium]
MAPPPGGPEDKQGPFLAGSVPANGAIQAPIGRDVTLYFSEPVVPPLKGKGLFISPRPQTEPEVSWKSDRVVVSLADSFQANQTYIISTAADIVDLRGNKMDSSLVIAFSTGPTIAGGAIGGLVFDQSGKSKTGATVGLYRSTPSADSLPFDSIYADYISQSNAEGRFSFGFLPNEAMLLVAFDDRDHNERLNPVAEAFGLSDRPVAIGGQLDLSALSLTLAARDTTTPEIIGASYTPDGILKVRLSKEVDVSQIRAHPDQISLVSSTDSNWSKSAVAVSAESDRGTAFSCYAGLLPAGSYRLLITFDSTREAIGFHNVTVSPGEDKTPPQLLRFSPDASPRMADEVVIEASFSEPIDTSALTSETFTLKQQPDKQLVPIRCRWQDPLTLRIEADSLFGGARYRMEVTEFEVRDLTGNALGDSLRAFDIRTISTDSLGSVSGTVEVAVPGREHDPVQLTFRRVEGKQEIVTVSDSGMFSIALPAGKYLLSGFVDSDGDGQPGRGSLMPLRYAETVATSPDTIAVRARFETAGIEFILR